MNRNFFELLSQLPFERSGKREKSTVSLVFRNMKIKAQQNL